MVRETKDLFTFIHWRTPTIATSGVPAKYKAITPSHLNFIRNNFFSKQFPPKCFCKLVNNISSYWNKSVSCRTSSLEMTVVWSWLQFFHLTRYITLLSKTEENNTYLHKYKNQPNQQWSSFFIGYKEVIGKKFIK